MRNKYPLSHPICGILLWQLWRTNPRVRKRITLYPYVYVFTWHSSLCVRMCLFSSFYKDASYIGSGPTLIQYDFILSCLHLQRLIFQMKSHSQVPRVKTLTYIFMKCNSSIKSTYREWQNRRVDHSLEDMVAFWNQKFLWISSFYNNKLQLHLDLILPEAKTV